MDRNHNEQQLGRKPTRHDHLGWSEDPPFLGELYLPPASHATDFSLPCIETYTTASTDPHRTDHIIINAYMRCVLMTSYGMRTMRVCGRVP
ncbi:hypothetical protein SFRURICE_011595 [Spodoptera frugiperda]|nr:hypothetical protein SFRURICE_011595 [Spodoptera frugiperda]